METNLAGRDLRRIWYQRAEILLDPAGGAPLGLLRPCLILKNADGRGYPLASVDDLILDESRNLFDDWQEPASARRITSSIELIPS